MHFPAILDCASVVVCSMAQSVAPLVVGCRGLVSTEIDHRKLSVRVLGTSAGDVKSEVEEQLGPGDGWGQWIFIAFIALAAVNI